LQPDTAGPFEIMGARHLIEGELAALAAKHATKAQVDGLRDALRRMNVEVSGGAMPIESDRLFHLRVAEVSGNGLLLRTVTQLYDQRNTPIFEAMGQHFENTATWRLAIAEHREVIDAIAAHKPAAARAAMHRHLKRSQARFVDTWPTNRTSSANGANDANGATAGKRAAAPGSIGTRPESTPRAIVAKGRPHTRAAAAASRHRPTDRRGEAAPAVRTDDHEGSSS
jgi:hypothetical protein